VLPIQAGEQVSAWRRKALEFLPELRREVNRKPYTVYWLFFMLLPKARRAHAEQDLNTLHRIYGFAEWCMRQRTIEPGNAAAVCFYEHLFDGTGQEYWNEIAQLLSPEVVEVAWPLWEFRLSPARFRELREFLAARGRPMRVEEYHEWIRNLPR
jgi:hypothetical protein